MRQGRLDVIRTPFRPPPTAYCLLLSPNQPEFLPAAPEGFQAEGEVVARVPGGDDRSQARASPRDHREGDRLREDTRVEEARAEGRRLDLVADHHRCDRGRGPAGVEAEIAQA